MLDSFDCTVPIHCRTAPDLVFSHLNDTSLEPLYSRVEEASTVLVKEGQLDPLEHLERRDPGVGGGNMAAGGKRVRRAPLTSCWPS